MPLLHLLRNPLGDLSLASHGRQLRLLPHQPLIDREDVGGGLAELVLELIVPGRVELLVPLQNRHHCMQDLRLLAEHLVDVDMLAVDGMHQPLSE